ncbi:MAG: KH domain-containing protein [Eubacterium sp.]|nr:KH domain-containing protein [Eubacterium sp.]
MKELLAVIAKHLVDNPDAVTVKDYMDDDALILELHVSDDDMGKVIGKQGRIAKAIRTVIKAAAIYEDKKVVVKIMQ